MFFGLPEAFRNFSFIARKGAEFKDLKELEAYLDDGDKPALELQRQYLIHEIRENLTHKIYVRQGMYEQGVRGIGLGYISYCLMGFESGITLMLFLLALVFREDGKNATAGIVFTGFLVFLLLTKITYDFGGWIHGRMMLERQFYYDMKPLCAMEIKDSLQTRMHRSFNDLIDREAKNKRRKICGRVFAVLWWMLVVVTFAYAYTFIKGIPLSNIIDQNVYDSIASATVIVHVFAVYGFLITLLVAVWPFSETQKLRNTVESLTSHIGEKVATFKTDFKITVESLTSHIGEKFHGFSWPWSRE